MFWIGLCGVENGRICLKKKRGMSEVQARQLILLVSAPARHSTPSNQTDPRDVSHESLPLVLAKPALTPQIKGHLALYSRRVFKCFQGSSIFFWGLYFGKIWVFWEEISRNPPPGFWPDFLWKYINFFNMYFIFFTPRPSGTRSRNHFACAKTV